MSYGYYPYYQMNQSTIDSYKHHQQQPQYYSNRSYSTESESQQQFNKMAPVSSNWLNTGLNASYNQYSQPGYQTPQTYGQIDHSQGYYNQFPQQFDSQKSYTQQSSKSNRSHRTDRESQTASQHSLTANTVNDDMNQLTPQIEAAYEEASNTTKRRQSVVKRQVITMPGGPGKVQQVVRRLPTPTPDVIERVFIVKPERDTVNLIIERPMTPPIQYKDKTVYGKSRRPLVNPKIIPVASRQYYQQLENYPYHQYQQMYLQNYQQAYQNIQSAEDYQQQQQPSIEAPRGYLIAPTNYDENKSIIQSYPEQQQQAPAQQQTFSTNVLQPYNPPMLEQYQSPQMNNTYMGYQPNQYGSVMNQF